MKQPLPQLIYSFRDSARPTGQDFTDLLDSCFNTPDQFTLGEFIGTPSPGAMRYSGNKIQFFDAGIWKDVGGSTSFFIQATGTDINYTNRVAIGFTPGSALVRTLEVGASNSATMARFGRAIAGGLDGGTGLGAVAFFSHQGQASAQGFALSQDQDGNTKLNSSLAGTLTLNNANVAVLAVTSDKKVVIGNGTNTPALLTLTVNADHPAGSPLQLHVQGDAIKSSGSSTWAVGSDIRFKEDIDNFQDGLEKLKQVRPVRFTYNGRGFGNAGIKQVGIIGQELEKIFPYMIHKAQGKLEEDGPEINDLRIFDSSPLTFVLINAIKELDEKIATLKSQLENHATTH